MENTANICYGSVKSREMTMRYILHFLTLCILPFMALADETTQCTLNHAALETILDEANVTVEKAAAHEEEYRAVSHQILLGSNVTVTYKEGGCEHYFFSLHYQGLENVPLNDRAASFAMVRDAIRATPIREEEKQQQILGYLDMLEAEGTLEAVIPEGMQSYGLYGDATLSLDIDTTSALFSYDFPL